MTRVKIIFYFILYLWACNKANAQFYSNLYIEGRPAMLFGSLNTLNGTLYVTGVTNTIRSPYTEKALFGKIQYDGTVDFINSIVDSDGYDYDIFYNSFKRTVDGNFIAAGNKVDSIQKAFLMKIDSNGTILLWHEYADTNALIYQGMDVAEIPDSGYLLAVNIDINNINNVRIIRTDLQGNALSAKNYFSGQISLPNIIRHMYNDHYMIGAWVAPATSNTPYITHTWLIEVDSWGNKIRDWLDPDPKNLWPNIVKATNG